MTGRVFELKRFALHDGPGIRSTLFLKGCPLRCPWCQNPEGISLDIRLWHQASLCLRCGSCVRACQAGALALEGGLRIDHAACTLCGGCIDACPTNALSFDGQEISVQEAVDLLLRDAAFFDKGGVTLSGGEPLFQWPFALEVLRQCKQRGINTALESCLYADREVLRRFLPVVDHFLIDLKFMDAETHRELLGQDNGLILSNYGFLVDAGADVRVRTPLIPGYTATEENIRAIARFVAQRDPEARYELLNFNPLCRSKYAALAQPYPVCGQAFSPADIDGFHDLLRQEGIKHIIRE